MQAPNPIRLALELIVRLNMVRFSLQYETWMGASSAWRESLSDDARNFVLLVVFWVVNYSVDARGGNFFARFERITNISHGFTAGNCNRIHWK